VSVSWCEIRLEVPVQCGEAIGNFLIEQGAPGLQFEEHGATVSLIAHFSSDPPLEPLRLLCADLGCPPDLPIQTQHIPEENWAENWKRHFQPERIGRRLYICPSWSTPGPPETVTILIDPGMAFGTGQHASTRGCLRLLETAVANRRITRALDLGTGSGILAIALAKLGVADVSAVDTDAEACAIAAANAQANQVSGAVRVCMRINETAGPFDLIVANLFANVLIDLAPRLTALMTSTATLICSGLLLEDERRVRVAYAAHGVRFGERDEESPWVTLAGRPSKPV
jgi:ribosomal protein L11 methyltransferase